MNIKKAASKTLLSFTLATTLLFTSNIGGSVVHAGVDTIVYPIPDPILRDFSYIEDTYNNDLSDKTVILTTNDVHGAIDGYPYLAGMKEYLDGLGADVILVDSGDFSQTKTENDDGTKKSPDEIFVTPENGLALKCLNSVGYDYVTLGNHEGYNIKKLKAQMEEKDKKPVFTTISSNILESGSKIDNKEVNYNPDMKSYFEANAIYDTAKKGKSEDKIKIGFFSLTTREGRSSTKDTDLALEGNMKKCAEKQCEILKSKGADIVICLSHLGLEQKFEEHNETSYNIYNEVKQIDLMIDGHSHSIITPTEGNEPILSTGTEFQNIGVVIIDNKEKKITDTFLVPNNVFTSFAPISPENSKAAAATAKVVEEVKKESKNKSKR